MSEQNSNHSSDSPKNNGMLNKFLNMPNDSTAKIVIMTVLVCLVCAIVVSTAAISLRGIQDHNRLVDKRENILLVAGLDDKSKSVNERFEQIESQIVDLSKGELTDQIDPLEFDQKASVRDPELSTKLTPSEDIAKIIRREDFAQIYILRDESNNIDKLILPVKGYGLWSTLYGFISLESDLTTIYRLKFYEHKETPGLGGEVDNPSWLGLWPGKKLFNQEGKFAFQVIKGNVTSDTQNAEYKVDGLAGATLTAKGVDNLFEFWMGEQGFGPFLNNLKSNSAGLSNSTNAAHIQPAENMTVTTKIEVRS